MSFRPLSSLLLFFHDGMFSNKISNNFFVSLTIFLIQIRSKRCASEPKFEQAKRIKSEDTNLPMNSIHVDIEQASHVKDHSFTKSQSEPPLIKRKNHISNTNIGANKFKKASVIHSPRIEKKRRSKTYSPSLTRSSSRPSTFGTVVTRSRTNSVGTSLQHFQANRAVSLPIVRSIASQQGSTPAVRYVGPPSQLVRAAQHQPSPVPPSISSRGTNARNSDSRNISGNQASSR